MSDEPEDKVAGSAAEKAKDRRSRRAVYVCLVAIVVGMVWLFSRGQVSDSRVDDLDEQSRANAASAAQNAAVANELAAQIRSLGAVPVVEPPAATPTAAPADTATIRTAARSAVLEYCGQPTEPCRGADGTSPNVDLIVAQVVAKMPLPKDGRDAPAVTAPELLAAVTQYCASPDEPCRGRPGVAGQTPPCLAEPGECRGADGRGVVSHEYLLVDGECVERTTYTADPTQVDIPVGAALCATPTEPTEPTDPIETPGG